jgi:hypothetical protein
MAHLLRFRPGFGALAVTVALGSVAPARGQGSSAGIVGRVIDQQSRLSIPGAQIALLGTPRRTNSDSAGRFSQEGLVAGTYVLQIRAMGYGVTAWVIHLQTGDVADEVFELAPVSYDLPPIPVEARPFPFQQRLRGFEQRRAAARGAFVTEDQIRTSRATTLVDVLRGLPGVRIACRSGTCVVEMTRTARGVCRADWVVDGFPATQSATPHIPTIGVVGIEVYRSPGETPMEFLKSDSQCGVIVVWTKSGP